MAEDYSTCAFCKIAAGRADAVRVAEGVTWAAFAPDEPAVLGHTLLVPKRHTSNFMEMRPDEAADLASVAQSLGRAVGEAVSADGVNLITSAGNAAEQSIFHTHFHILPRYQGDPIRIWPTQHQGASAAEVSLVARRISATLRKRET